MTPATKRKRAIIEGDRLSLNVGCGPHRAVEPWINFDIVNKPDANIVPDYVAHLHDLPVNDGSVVKLFAGHTIEHLSIHDGEDGPTTFDRSMAEIKRVLNPETGIAAFVCPDVYRAIQWYRDGKMDFDIVDACLEGPDSGIDPASAWDGCFHAWNCLSGDTEVMTLEGVRPIRSLAGGDHHVLASAKLRNGHWTPAEFRSFGQAETLTITMHRGRTTKTIRATGNHRWFVDRTKKHVRHEVTTADLAPGDRLSSCYATSPLRSVTPSPQGIAHGIVYGDGTRWKNPRQPAEVTLCGEKDAELIKWFPQNRTRVRPGIGITVCDLPRAFKAAPDLSESVSYLLGWLLGYLAADGTVGANGHTTLASASEASIRLARDVACIIGVPTGAITEARSGSYGDGTGKLYVLNFPVGAIPQDLYLLDQQRLRAHARQERRAAGWTVESVEPYGVEEVFCAVEPETHSFTLAENLLTGNCHEQRLLALVQKTFPDAIAVPMESSFLAPFPVVSRVGWQCAVMTRSPKK